MHPASVWGPRASVCKALEPLCGALELATQGILFLFTDGHTQKYNLNPWVPVCECFILAPDIAPTIPHWHTGVN